jgi:hypothetical protein
MIAMVIEKKLIKRRISLAVSFSTAYTSGLQADPSPKRLRLNFRKSAILGFLLGFAPSWILFVDLIYLLNRGQTNRGGPEKSSIWPKRLRSDPLLQGVIPCFLLNGEIG